MSQPAEFLDNTGALYRATSLEPAFTGFLALAGVRLRLEAYWHKGRDGARYLRLKVKR